MTVGVSVLIPVHDAAPTLAAALSSVTAQTASDFEAVVVLNGCTDASAEIAREHAARDRRFVVVERPEGDLVGGLNAGIAGLRAPVVARLDADDVMAPERLAVQLAALERHPEWTAVTSRVVCEAIDGGPAGAGMSRYVDWLNGLTTPAAIAHARFIDAPVCQPAVTMRTAALRGVGGYRSGPFAEDHDLWLRLLGTGAHFGAVPEALLTWRDHPSRLTRSDSRYAAVRRRALVHGHLLAGPLAGGRPCRLWGAGRYGRAHARGLRALGAVVEDVIDIDPRKFGREVAGGLRVVDAATVGPPAGRLILLAVASPGARAVVSARLERLGHAPGRDYLPVQ